MTPAIEIDKSRALEQFLRDCPYALGPDRPTGLRSIPLAENLAPAGSLPRLEILRYAHQAAQALASAHGYGIVHGEFGTEAIVLERIERHCCEAEKFRLRLGFSADPVPLTDLGRKKDVGDFGRWLFAIAAGRSPRSDERLAELSSDAPAELIAVESSCRAENPPDMLDIVRRIERAVARIAFPHATPAAWAGAFAIDVGLPGAIFVLRPILGLFVFVAADLIVRAAAERTAGERILGLAAPRGTARLLRLLAGTVILGAISAIAR